MSASAKTVSAPLEEFDGYRLVRPIGRGTMGQVYLAHDTLLDRSVAVKFIAAVDPNPEQRERFFLEARAVARLQHPNVVTIYRVGEALEAAGGVQVKAAELIGMPLRTFAGKVRLYGLLRK